MADQETLAQALARVYAVTEANGGSVLRGAQILRKDRELLIRENWLREILKGWYMLSKPGLPAGDSSAWYANFWVFLGIYLRHHLQEGYVLSAENSLDLLTGVSQIPTQVVVIGAKGGGTVQPLPYNTSILIYADPNNVPEEVEIKRGVRVMTLPYALCRVSPTYFLKNPQDAEIALRMVPSAAEFVHTLAKHQLKSAAGRLLGAYKFLGYSSLVEGLEKAFVTLGWSIKEVNPFQSQEPLLSTTHIPSPYVARIQAMWSEYRRKVIGLRSLFKQKPVDLESLNEVYQEDAYNSLSIEGYVVDRELILRVQDQKWNPDTDFSDNQQKDLLAARGYYEAFLEVKKSIARIASGANPGDVFASDLQTWVQALFAPNVRAALLKREDLLGYRRGQVYIRGSFHVPLPKEALVSAMEALFDCLRREEDPVVRAVLGHYVFVFIHPFMDGNGRIGRLLMNAMLVSGGFPWTIVHASKRKEYLSSLEEMTLHRDIGPFVKLIATEMTKREADALGWTPY